jgi:CDP-6-deoxy-D-xylo-4-hexulose-3-dehydrase
MIPLVRDTINKEEMMALGAWISSNPRLTRGILCEEFEHKWSNWLGTKYSHFVNSGSSANLMIFEALKASGRLKSNNVIVPAVGWVTTVTPVIQTGLTPILCDADEQNLGLKVDHLEQLLKEHDIAAVILVHVLGVPDSMDEILSLREKYGFILIEDACEAAGSQYMKKNIGTMGLMSSFSFYFGHHLSTIEGGMVCTDDEELYTLVKSISSHGWARDLNENYKRGLEKRYTIDPFDSFYTFYYTGYNLRSTDLNAFLGMKQLERLDTSNRKRNNNYLNYKNKLKTFWAQTNDKAYVSSFAYALISENRNTIVKDLLKNSVECRPLICGSIGRQPFWIEKYGLCALPVADKVHFQGFYVPNNPDLTEDEINFICNIITASEA